MAYYTGGERVRRKVWREGQAASLIATNKGTAFVELDNGSHTCIPIDEIEKAPPQAEVVTFTATSTDLHLFLRVAMNISGESPVKRVASAIKAAMEANRIADEIDAMNDDRRSA